MFREKFDGNLFGINCNLKGEALWQTEREKNTEKFKNLVRIRLIIYLFIFIL